VRSGNICRSPNLITVSIDLCCRSDADAGRADVVGSGFVGAGFKPAPTDITLTPAI
jgi:hypothetical protein